MDDALAAVVAGDRCIVVIDVEASPPLEQVLASWSRYELWQLDLDLDACGLSKLAVPFLDVKKLALVVGARSFDTTARELSPEAAALPRHRAIADACQTARILNRLLSPLM